MEPCDCKTKAHSPKLVVLTGGPGAGKTAVLELIRKTFCEHVQILPEAASILFSGGFIRKETDSARRSLQRAIYHVQRELEHIVLGEENAAVILCDRGTLDGLAYWAGDEASFFDSITSSMDLELKRYEAVIHLKCPSVEHGFNHQNPIRIESAEQAAVIDQKIGEVWKRHPHYFLINSSKEFMEKARMAIQTVKNFVPPCCQKHQGPTN